MNKIKASVLAFEKKLVPSDGLMYGITWSDGANAKQRAVELKLQEKSVRGTISNRLKKSEEGKLDAKIESANLQTIDSCALGLGQDTLKLSFTLKILSGIENPSSCNNEEFSKTYDTAIKKYIKDFGFKEIALAYATNIANGRFLWRNRVGSEKVEIEVKTLEEDNNNWTFDGTNISLRNFDNPNKDIQDLAEQIAKTLSGEKDFLLLEINAYSKMGKLQDVYPSEELVLDKGNSKNKKSKILYNVKEVAAMHSQKIGNAIRTIDIWYPEYENKQIPISIDPYGAVTNLGKAYRNPKNKIDFFTLFDAFAQGEEIKDNDKHFVMAVLVRGGVFGEKQ
jgi:CRISPR-associated protein Csy3